MKRGLIINVYPQLYQPLSDELFYQRLKEQKIDLSSDDKSKKAKVLVFYNTDAAFAANAPVLQEYPNAERIIYEADNKYLQLCKELPKDVRLLRSGRKRILIAIPCYQYIEPETMHSIYNMITPVGYEASFIVMRGYTVQQARNRIVSQSLAMGFDYTLFVDSDVLLPKQLLANLVAINADIATGWYIKKTIDAQITELYGPDKLGQRRMVNIDQNELPKQGVIPILGCGFGCTLVKNEVFNKIGASNWFEYIEKPDYICSEDLNFCDKARAAGCSIVADVSLRCPHIGRITF